jgi:hypothetical protein
MSKNLKKLQEIAKNDNRIIVASMPKYNFNEPENQDNEIIISDSQNIEIGDTEIDFSYKQDMDDEIIFSSIPNIEETEIIFSESLDIEETETLISETQKIEDSEILEAQKITFKSHLKIPAEVGVKKDILESLKTQEPEILISTQPVEKEISEKEIFQEMETSELEESGTLRFVNILKTLGTPYPNSEIENLDLEFSNFPTELNSNILFIDIRLIISNLSRSLIFPLFGLEGSEKNNYEKGLNFIKKELSKYSSDIEAFLYNIAMEIKENNSANISEVIIMNDANIIASEQAHEINEKEILLKRATEKAELKKQKEIEKTKAKLEKLLAEV